MLTVNIIENTENSSLVVQWDEVDDSLPTTYTITWTSDFPIHSDTLIEQSPHTIIGSTFDTIYTITVAAANRCGTGPEFKTKMLYSTDAIGAVCNIACWSTSHVCRLVPATCSGTIPYIERNIKPFNFTQILVM